MKRSRHLLLAVAALLLLAGCLIPGLAWQSQARFVDADQPIRGEGPGLPLEPGVPAGQTFVARHDGLTGIEFYLLPLGGAPATVTLHLRADPQAASDLASDTLQLPPDAKPGFYRFDFAPLAGAHGQYAYAFLESGAPGPSLAIAAGDSYLDGAAHQAHQPLDAQTAFRLVYAPAHVALDLVKAVLGWVTLAIVSGLIFVVPGWALLAWLWPGRRLSWAEMLGLSVGVSLALYPLLLLWGSVLGLKLGLWYAWLPVLGGLAALAWRYRTWRPRGGWRNLRKWWASASLWPDLALLTILILVFGARLLVVRSLEAPLWGDSYQHTMMAQLLVDNGGLFSSWLPYTPYQSLTVHFGFPTVTALLSWVTGKGSVETTLLAGQILNGIAALTLYPLAVRLGRGNRWAGAGAVFVAGLASPMPAFYVNWGRYPQLAGQAILPVALWLMWDAVENRQYLWRAVWLAGAVAAGMTLSYYRMPYYYAPFFLAWLVGWGLPCWRGDVHRWLWGLLTMILVAVCAVLFFLPWISNLAGGQLVVGLAQGVSQGAPLDRVLADYQIWRHVTNYVPALLLIAALLALVWSLVRRQWVVASLGLWMLLLALLVAGRLVHLPGAKKLQNFGILIALYIPISLLAGWLVGEAASWLQRRAGRAGQWIAAGLLLLLALVTMGRQIRIVESSFVLVTRPDARAMAWIQENTPADAHFLVEGFPIMGGFSVVGSDAGWWIPLLTGRGNTMPPQYALMNEQAVVPGHSQRVVDLVAQLRAAPPTSPQGLQLLCDGGISHVYIGQGQGMVGIEAEQLFSPKELAASRDFGQVYQQDRVHIFALKPEACQAGSQ